MQPRIHFLEVGDTHMFLSALSSMSRPPIRALAKNERQPDRDHVYDCVYGIELFRCFFFFTVVVVVVWGFEFLGFFVLLLHTGAWLSQKFQLSSCRWSL